MYSVSIDFDEASRAWRENKIKLSNGCYKYKPQVHVCSHMTVKGNQCRNRIKGDSIQNVCRIHLKHYK